MAKCVAMKKDGETCDVSAKFIVKVMAAAGTAYRMDNLPTRLLGGNWGKTEVTLCGTHRNALQNNAISINNNEENEMEEYTNCNAALPEGLTDEMVEAGMAAAAIEKFNKRNKEDAKMNTGILCGNCRKNGFENPRHETVEQVKACYGHKSEHKSVKPVKKAEKEMESTNNDIAYTKALEWAKKNGGRVIRHTDGSVSVKR